MAKEMRAVFSEKLLSLMEKNENIVVIDADLARANGTLGIRAVYPERAFDVGVAEANMASVAAGMAACGFIPFIGTFTPFASRRICDQITISICYAGRNVKIVGSDPGVTAEYNGGTHMSVEDIGVLRSIPNLVIFEPVDATQFAQALEAITDYEGPVYIRMFRKEAEDVFGPEYRFDLFKADTVKEGKDVSIFASGFMVQQSVKAVQALGALGIDAELINIHTIKPIDRQAVIASAKKTGAVVTCDNHNIIGGLGSAVAEVLAEECPTKMRRVGIQDRFGEVGKLNYLCEAMKLRPEDIVQAVQDLLGRA